jgi:hypothetical protein
MGKPKPPKRDEGDNVKTTVELPPDLWRAAKIRAVDDRSDFRAVVIAALEAYLGKRPTGR